MHPPIRLQALPVFLGVLSSGWLSSCLGAGGVGVGARAGLCLSGGFVLAAWAILAVAGACCTGRYVVVVVSYYRYMCQRSVCQQVRCAARVDQLVSQWAL